MKSINTMPPQSGQGEEADASSSAKVRFIPLQRSFYPQLVTIFVAVFIISNITATKGVTLNLPLIGPLHTDGAFFLFPLAYVIGDVLSECYGFAATRRAIYLGFGVMLLTVASFYIAISLPSADFYENQQEFSLVLGLVPGIVAASLAGYLVGQLLNSYALVAIKKLTGEKSLWARLLGSTLVGEFGDTLIFCLIAAPIIGISSIGDTANYVIVGFIWKTGIELVMMPITYRVIAWVKNKEGYYTGS